MINELLFLDPFLHLQAYLLIRRNVIVSVCLAEYCLPLVRVGGLFVAAKGHDPQVCDSSSAETPHYLY